MQSPEELMTQEKEHGVKRRKIVFVTELFYPSVGGQEVRFLELAGLFTEHGWEVEVLTIATQATAGAQESLGSVKVNRLTYDERYQRPYPWLRRNPITIGRFALAVRKWLASHSCDVVVFNQWPLLPQMLAPRGRYITVNDWCEHRSGLFWKVINSLLARSTDKHICVSDALRQLLESRYGLRGAQSIPSGIFLNAYQAAEEKRGILFFGRLSEHKHPEDAVKAYLLAREQGLDEDLTVAGGGPLLEHLRRTYGHLPYIHIPGRVSDEEKLRLFSSHRIYVLPSEREGFPRTIAESMACGTPIITTRYPDNGSVDVVDLYRCGLVVAPAPEAIAEGLLSLSRNPAQWESYADSGLRGASELDWNVVFNRFSLFLGYSS